MLAEPLERKFKSDLTREFHENYLKLEFYSLKKVREIDLAQLKGHILMDKSYSIIYLKPYS